MSCEDDDDGGLASAWEEDEAGREISPINNRQVLPLGGYFFCSSLTFFHLSGNILLGSYKQGGDVYWRIL